MEKRLHVSSVEVEADRLLLGFGVGAVVELADMRKLRDLADGREEHAMTVQSGDASFEVRVVAGVSGGIESVVCSAENIPDDWHKPLVDAQRAERESPLS